MLKDIAIKFNTTGFGNALHTAVMRYRSLDLRPVCPKFLHIETTSLCNARCLMCAHPQMKRPKLPMNDELFDKIVIDAKDMGIKWVNLQFYGEPLLDKKIYERIHKLKKHGFKVKFNSNASLLDKEAAVKLLESEIDQVNISFDAFSKERYNKIRIGLDYDEVKKNIREFVAISRQRDRRPFTMITFVCLDVNKHEAVEFSKEWKGIVDKILISFARDWAGQKKVDGHKSGLDISGNVCKALWKDLIILQDGKVALCCNDYEGDGEMGDANKQALKEIWNGEKFVYYRKIHREGKRSTARLCANCDYYSFWWIK